MFIQESSGPLSLCPMRIGTSGTSARKFWLPLLLRVIKSVVSDPDMSCLPPASTKVRQCYNLSVSLQIVLTVLTGHKASPLCPISGLVKNKINNKCPCICSFLVLCISSRMILAFHNEPLSVDTRYVVDGKQSANNDTLTNLGAFR